MSICPETAESLKDRERNIRRNMQFPQGTVEQAVHSHRMVEELLFHTHR